MGDSRFAHCLQGGGVNSDSGTVTITSSSISGNRAPNVRARVQKFSFPMADISYLDPRLHNCGRYSGQLQQDVRASE